MAARIRFLRECYAADRRSFRLTDYRKVDDRFVIEGRERLATGELPRITLFGDRAETLASKAALAGNDSELLYGTFFLAGGADEGTIAPLILYPAALGEEQELTLDLGAPRVNDSLLEAFLVDRDERDALAGLLGELAVDGFDGASALATVVDGLSRILGAAVEELSVFPNLMDARKAARFASSPDTQGLPLSVLMLIRRSLNTRGVLQELEELEGSPDHSEPLQQILTATGRPGTAPVPLGSIPVVLSERQREIATAAARNALTLAIGPPGTGKSFTATAVALEHVARGNTVLLGAQTEQALDVLQAMLVRFLESEEPVMRAGRGDQRKVLIHRLENQLAGHVPEPDVPARAELEQQRDAVTRRLNRAVRRFEGQLRRELSWSRVLTGDAFAAGFRRPFVRWRARREEPQWDVLADLEDAIETRNTVQGQLLRRCLHERRTALVRERRKELKSLVKALRARKGSRRLDHFSAVDLDAVLHAFPIWIAPLNALHQALPLRSHLFDLCILDEATQSDCASALPMLQRARRALLIGDFKQLRHVSFLSRQRQRALAENADLDDADIQRLDYRERSILDVADDAVESQDAVITLNEHFRSTPPIIAFSNARFYSGGLRIMTQRPTVARDSLAVVAVAGRRDPDGINPQEIDRIVAEIRNVVAAQASLPPAGCHSIGVLSPFRNQVERLRDVIGEAIPLDVQRRHGIRVNTAHGFQGEERDVMLLSWVVDESAPSGSFTFLRRPDVVNVAVTRARLRQLSFVSLPTDSPRLPELVRDYLSSARSESAAIEGVEATEDPFIREIQAVLEELGAQCFVAHPVAGMDIDLVACRGDRVIGFDLVGYPGPYVGRFSLERLRVFYRAGLPIVPIPYSLWTLEPETVRSKLSELIP